MFNLYIYILKVLKKVKVSQSTLNKYMPINGNIITTNNNIINIFFTMQISMFKAWNKFLRNVFLHLLIPELCEYGRFTNSCI